MGKATRDFLDFILMDSSCDTLLSNRVHQVYKMADMNVELFDINKSESVSHIFYIGGFLLEENSEKLFQ